jgi:hypothetical protein
MLVLSCEQAIGLRDVLARIDDDETGQIMIRRDGLGADLTIVMDDGIFMVSGGGTVERV